MVIDTSALLAILLAEPERRQMIDAMESDPTRLVSAPTGLEAAIVIHARKGPSGGRELDLLLHTAQIAIVPFTADHAAIAREAWLRFGKGRHPAGLNVGDCCSYALSVESRESLLFKGLDFAKTDVRPAAYPP